MRALIIRRYGDLDAMSLEVGPDPVAGPGDVLIRVAAAGLNPVDQLQREGTFKAISPLRFPAVLGNELSGTVEVVGTGVTRFSAGDRVITRVGGAALGAFAELAAVPAEYVAHAPTSIPLADAAGLPLAGLTAQQALGPDHLDVQPGDRLLITGGAGGVGLLAIQLAALAGAEVTVTASSAGHDLVTAAGADHVIDYRSRSVADGGERFDKVLDLVGGDSMVDLFGSIDRGGRLVTLSGPPSPGSLTASAAPSRRPLAAVAAFLGSRSVMKTARAADVSYEFFLMHPDGQGLARLVDLVDAGSLDLRIDSRYPMTDYRAAFERLESRRAKGKVLLDIAAE